MEAAEQNVPDRKDVHFVKREDKCCKQIRFSWLTLLQQQPADQYLTSLNRRDLLQYIETPIELTSTELLVMPTKPCKLMTIFS